MQPIYQRLMIPLLNISSGKNYRMPHAKDGNLVSFFVVNEENRSISKNLYVSPDWPSAQAFATNRLASEPMLPQRNS
jgi:hypothetical protein